MKSQFELDIEGSSDRLASYILEGKRDQARRELDWIRDHSSPTACKSEIIARLHRDIDGKSSDIDAHDIEMRVKQLRQEALAAGPTHLDKTLLIY